MECSPPANWKCTIRNFFGNLGLCLLLAKCFTPQPIDFSGGFRGGSGGSLEPLSGAKLFQFHGEIYENVGKMLKTNPLLMDLNPPSRNPGSTPGFIHLSFLKGRGYIACM